MFVGMVALIKTVGITPVGKVFQNADQFRLERATANASSICLAIGLCGTRHVIMRFGAAFDFKAIHADLDQTLHMLDSFRSFEFMI